MAHVLSTKRARKRVVAAVPIGLLVAWFIYGFYIVQTVKPEDAHGFAYLSGMLATVVMVIVAILVLVGLLYLLYHGVRYWINQGE